MKLSPASRNNIILSFFVIAFRQKLIYKSSCITTILRGKAEAISFNFFPIICLSIIVPCDAPFTVLFIVQQQRRSLPSLPRRLSWEQKAKDRKLILQQFYLSIAEVACPEQSEGFGNSTEIVEVSALYKRLNLSVTTLVKQIEIHYPLIPIIHLFYPRSIMFY